MVRFGERRCEVNVAKRLRMMMRWVAAVAVLASVLVVGLESTAWADASGWASTRAKHVCGLTTGSTPSWSEDIAYGSHFVRRRVSARQH